MTKLETKEIRGGAYKSKNEYRINKDKFGGFKRAVNVREQTEDVVSSTLDALIRVEDEKMKINRLLIF